MSDSELEYLSPSFDPNSLTVPRLRSILVTHNVSYPSSAKKAQLIEIFTEHVLPQSRKILNARNRARRTSKGIENAEGSQITLASEELAERAAMPPPPTPRRAVRRSTRSATEESAEDDEATPKIRRASARTPGRRATNKQARTTDTDTGTDTEVKRPAAVRKTRKSEAAPTPVVQQVKTESKDDGFEIGKHHGEDGAFSSDNPFQSGSSPLTAEGPRATSGEMRRKSTGSGVKDATKRKSSSTARQRTESPTTHTQADDNIYPPSSKTLEIPISRLKNLPPAKVADGVNGVEPGEEFTPEEQVELAREREKDGTTDTELVPPRRPKRAGPSHFWRNVAVGMLAISGGFFYWWRKEKIDIGYCGVGRANTNTQKVVLPDWITIPDWATIPDWPSFLEPKCEACPQHGYCYPSMVVHCEPDFILMPHPLELWGLLPLVPTCEPDGTKAMKVQAVADKAVEELRERRAKFECGDLKDEQGESLPTPEIEEDVLKQEVSKLKGKKMSEDEFEELWKSAIGEIMARDEVESGIDG
jgi:hypothetical protein